MTNPTGDHALEPIVDSDLLLDVHACVILEDERDACIYERGDVSFAYPLMFVRATEDFQYATSNADSRYDEARVIGAERYLVSRDYTIWRVPRVAERMYDVSRLDRRDSRSLDEIVDLIIKYNIVYFLNIPSDYKSLFHDVGRRWKSKVVANARLYQSVEKR